MAASGPANNALLEALGPDWHFGEVLAFERAGHIPQAILLPAGDFYNSDKTFKSPGEMRKMLAYLCVSPEQTVYAHCGGGVAASVPFFALRFMLGFDARRRPGDRSPSGKRRSRLGPQPAEVDLDLGKGLGTNGLGSREHVHDRPRAVAQLQNLERASPRPAVWAESNGERAERASTSGPLSA